jgi:hypothetical protein
MIRAIVKLAIVALVVHAAVRTVPVCWTYIKFRDAVAETVKFSSKRSEKEVLARVIQIARRYDIPISESDVTVRKHRDTTFVETRYTAQLEILPTRFYPWVFEVKVEGVPPRGELIP